MMRLPLVALASIVLVLPIVAMTAPAANAATGEFVETFDGNRGMRRFDFGVWHRDDVLVANRSWPGDHDLECGTPDTQRVIERSDWRRSFYTCRDHLMSSVGDTSGYSIAYFRPRRTFTRGDVTTVSWDVNSTYLGSRQWWEVMIQPAGSTLHDAAKQSVDGTACDGACTTVDWLAGVFGLAPYGSEDIVVGSGPFGQDTPRYRGEALTSQHLCGDDALDPEGCREKHIRRTWSVTDNMDGTLTIRFLDNAWEVQGRFPDRFEVVFKDHSYTPDKDGPVAGYTWHWDNIAITRGQGSPRVRPDRRPRHPGWDGNATEPVNESR
jgi:hypothetical protein